MEKRAKITEIKETYTQKRRVRKENGEYVFEDVTLTRYKPVNYVDGWARFGAFLLDYLFAYIFIFIVEVALVIIIGIIGGEEILGSRSLESFLNLAAWLVFYPAYYIVFEGAASASLAKIILGRVVVNEYGEKPSFGQIIGRSFARIVPFEAFSCLSTLGWHDEWSKTFVLRKKDLQGLKLALKVQEFDKPDTSGSAPPVTF